MPCCPVAPSTSRCRRSPRCWALNGSRWRCRRAANSAIPAIFTKVGGALGDVNEILAFARSHHASVHSLSSATVDGTSVTGSRVTAHVKRLKVIATLWANTSDQLVQARVVAALRPIDISAVVNFTGYDTTVAITAPASSQVKAIPLSVITSVLGGLLNHAHLGHRHGAQRL